MGSLVLILIVLALSSLFYFVAKRRSLSIAGGLGGIKQLHSAPRYYGFVAALLFSIPALTVLGLWVTIDESIILRIVLAEYFPEVNSEMKVSVDLIISQIKILSQSGQLGGGEIIPVLQAAVERYQNLTGFSQTLRNSAVLALGSIVSFVFVLTISAKLRARPIAEAILRGLLLFSSLIAIFTTVGIVLSVLFEAINFFRKILLRNFCLGLNGVHRLRFGKTRWAHLACSAAFRFLLGLSLSLESRWPLLFRSDCCLQFTCQNMRHPKFVPSRNRRLKY